MHHYDSTPQVGGQQVIRLRRSMLPLDPAYEPAPYGAGDPPEQFFDATLAHDALVRRERAELAAALLAPHDAAGLAGLARHVAAVAAGEETAGTAEACGAGANALTALALWLGRSSAAGCDATGVASAAPARDRVDAEWAAAVASFFAGDDGPIL